jgi:Polyketide cyclase / dehydrase and lipid transport
MQTMAKFEINLVINRSNEEVFGFISNAENQPLWRASVLEVTRTSSEPFGIGSVFKARFSFLGRPFDGDLTVIAHEPYEKYGTNVVGGPFPLEARYALLPTANGTQLTLFIEGEPGGFFKLAEPLVVSLAKRSYEADLHNLKDLLEAQAVQAA